MLICLLEQGKNFVWVYMDVWLFRKGLWHYHNPYNGCMWNSKKQLRKAMISKFPYNKKILNWTQEFLLSKFLNLLLFSGTVIVFRWSIKVTIFWHGDETSNRQETFNRRNKQPTLTNWPNETFTATFLLLLNIYLCLTQNLERNGFN